MMTVPWRASQQALLRIFSEENDAYFDISDDVFTIGDSIAPTISNLMFSEVVSLESDVLIEATITDNPGGINSAKIFYLINGRSQIEQVDMTEGETGQYEGTVPGSDVGLTGLSFIIQAIDNAGNVRLGDRQYIQVECTGGITRTSASGAPVYQPAGNNVDSYRIFSVPLDLTAKSASAFLEANPMIDPYDPEQCRIFSASGSDLVEYPNIGQVRPGKAFLMITNVDNLQIHTPPGKSVNTDGPFVVNSISSGWSLIGNPFNFSLPMDSIRCSVEGVEYWKYSGSWSRNTSGMVPWLGYAVWMPSAGSISFYPGVSGVGKEVDPYVTNASKPETWFLRIQASGSETEDSFTIVGQSQEAVNGYDGLDLHKPPRLQNEVRLALLNSEVSAKREQLAADIRQPDPDGHVWDLQCRLEDGTDRVMLEIHGMEDIPPGFGVWLMDCRQNYVYDLRHRTRIPFQAEAAEVLDFQILAGQQTMLEDLNLPVKMVPSRFALDQNFPNPFNPVTQIRYSLAEDARVRLEIYNMLGRSMALLTDAQQPAGEYVYEWNAGDLPTGIYLIRFQADSYSAMKKCMLIK